MAMRVPTVRRRVKMTNASAVRLVARGAMLRAISGAAASAATCWSDERTKTATHADNVKHFVRACVTVYQLSARSAHVRG